jgi:hypothetical protein
LKTERQRAAFSKTSTFKHCLTTMLTIPGCVPDEGNRAWHPAAAPPPGSLGFSTPGGRRKQPTDGAGIPTTYGGDSTIMAINLKDRLTRQAAGDTQLSFDPTGRDEPRLATLPLQLIDPDPDQPRKDLGPLADLALSIREHGVLQPLIVEAVAEASARNPLLSAVRLG